VYAKIFSQIFDSSLADDYELRHFFMDLLVLADSDGVVDMTETSIAARTRIPLEKVKSHLVTLCNADVRSRTPDDDGKRIKLIDDHRDWGWIIINYDKFRDIASDMQRREKTRLRVKKHRDKVRCNAHVTPSNTPVTPLSVSVGTGTSESSEGKSAEKGRGVEVEKPGFKKAPEEVTGLMRIRLSFLFSRHSDDPWSYEEDRELAAIIINRPHAFDELTEIEQLYQRGNKSKQSWSVLSLLRGWTTALDKFRKGNLGHLQPQTVNRNIGTMNEGKEHGYAEAARKQNDAALARIADAKRSATGKA